MRKNRVDINILNNECNVFLRYLIDHEPNSYVRDKYIDAHTMSDVFHNPELNHFDTFLMNVSVRHPFFTKLVDSYTSVFYRNSIVRKKWVLLLSIMESYAPTSSYFDLPDSVGEAILWMKMLQKGLIFVLAIFVSMILFMPFYLAFIIRSNFKSL